MTYHVAPAETRPARLASLPKLPIFFDLQGRRVVISGRGEAAAWKAELMAAAGAKVTVYAAEICSELAALIESGKDIAWVGRAWRDADLDHAWIAIADCEAADEAARLSAAARSRGVLVNVIDQPGLCDFQFGTIVNRAPVVIGISTDGGAPILGQAIRRRIEAVLPATLGGWAAAAKQFRGRLKEIVPSKAGRRRFWEKFVDVSFISQAEEDDRLAELERLAQDILHEKDQAQVGEVVIVGAGPGDPELMTMKAVRELQAADVIVYDRLVSVDVLELGRREARRILVGKKGHGPACSQDEINALLVRLAREGKRVARLKGGDPSVFGRTAEELGACRAAGIPARIVPGVTTASAAAASLGVSLTQRGVAQRVQFITGYDRNGGLPADLDLAALADPLATTVVYMGRRTIGELARRIIARGLPGETPAIIVSNVSRHNETHIQTNLAELAERFHEDRGDPTLILIGNALAASSDAASPVEAEFEAAAAA
jgi:uroporphyrin-III C-methyltransferase/precorrin-2 dehydrogenase/sirohydrochlorin ferrochelatase